jgi:arabinofuranosyltransferase
MSQSTVSHADSSTAGEHVPVRDLDKWLRPIIGLLLFFFVILVLKSAWLSEDSYIGWRTVDNFVHGHGLRWNLLDRVQVFTDPLFILLVSPIYAITHEIFITATVICLLLSALAVYLIVGRLALTPAAAIAGMAAFLSSRAFIDYSTSGLENPLSFLLAAIFCLVYFRTPVFSLRITSWLVFTLALIGLNRLDAILLFAPAMFVALATTILVDRPPWLRLIKWLIIASSPLWLWILFSILYYGFPFPNTYYAKLHTGIPDSELLFQGLLYYFHTVNVDAVTLVVIAASIFLAIARREIRAVAVACGIAFYLVYILKIGGDFMSGRFFSIPFFLAVALLVRVPLRTKGYLALAICFIGIGFLSPHPTFFNDERYFDGVPMKEVIDHRGIADERGFIFHMTGLLPVLDRRHLQPRGTWVARGTAVRQSGSKFSIFGNIGLYGFYAGRHHYILDCYGLADPLLSKLPIINNTGNAWRIGHFERTVPAGYPETIRTGVNKIQDSRIAKLYNVIKVIVQGPVWSVERFKQIFLINTGHYDKLMVQPQTEEKGATDWKKPWRPAPPKHVAPGVVGKPQLPKGS